MEMKCAECDCVVEKGVRVRTCNSPGGCCCSHLSVGTKAAN